VDPERIYAAYGDALFWQVSGVVSIMKLLTMFHVVVPVGKLCMGQVVCASGEPLRIEPLCHGHGRFPKLKLRHGARRELLDCSLDRSGTRCVVRRIGRMQIKGLCA
jgi:hypothetical protein